MLIPPCEPIVHLRKTDTANGTGSPGCWVGGLPTLPQDIKWPYYKNEDLPSVPMYFVAQIDLSQVPVPSVQTGLPKQGTLFFFYDTTFAPVHGMLKDGCKVIYVKDDVSAVPPRAMPDLHIPENHSNDVSYYFSLHPPDGFRRHNVTLTEHLTEKRVSIRPNFIKRFLGKPVEERITPAPPVLHYLMGDVGEWHSRYTENHIRLFTLWTDHDIGHKFYVAYFILPDDLSNLNFDEVLVREV